jgi:exopolysaccharide biosynthesis polyprenyl glycosylphosphotransferase
MHRVVVAGSPATVADLIRGTRRATYAGMSVVGCCIDQRGPVRVTSIEDVPVVGDLSTITSAVRTTNATSVAVTASGEVTGRALRRLSWELEGTGVDILVAPALTDIAGPRIHIRPVAGLPLLHVEEPELSGGRRLLKGLFDRSVALAAILLLLPVLVTLGLAVRLSSSGPTVFRQTRVGRGGRQFTILKFRSMYTDAEAKLETLLMQNERAEGLLFKIRKDPRVTPVGRFLRRYSLDELPQLFNVLRGDMSLVGPRPPLPSEVERYESEVHRRLLVKPGLTGLWQVSGRSDLTWEESVRLDLEYVENWSLALDAMILWKTLFAVVRASGAY